MPGLRKATLQDALHLSTRLSEADLREVKAASGGNPGSALAHGVIYSHPCITIHGDDDAPVGMFGVTPLQDGQGAIWMLASDELRTRYSYPFLRQCRGIIRRLNEVYPLLFNYVDARNEVHIRWIAWCGFTFLRTIPYGINGEPFHEFAMVKINV